MLKIIIGTMTAVFMAPIASAAAATCKEQRKTFIGSIEYQVRESGGGHCWYMAGPADRGSMLYRDYLFDDQGFILVFTSYGFGDESKTSGGREYYVFPRSHDVGMTADADGVRVAFANGSSALYSAKTAMWEDVQGATLEEKKNVKVGDQGGWELRPHSGVVLDFGFRMGGSPSGHNKGKAMFVDAKGETCSVNNAEVVRWDSNGDPDLKFANDAAVESFLRTRCPDISWR